MTLGAMLAATFSLTNCTEEIKTVAPEVEGEKVPYTIFANAADTKTVNDGAFGTKWFGGNDNNEPDAINVFHAEAGSSWYSKNTKFVVTNAETGEFATEYLEGELSASNDWYVLYPYKSSIDSPINETAYLPVGSTHNGLQEQKGNDNMKHIGGYNYPMLGKALNVESDELPYIRMTHLSSLIEVEVTNSTDDDVTVNSVVVITPEDVDIIGTYFIDFSMDTPKFTPSSTADRKYVSNVAKLKVKDGEVIAPGASAKFYLAVKPFELEVGHNISLIVNGAIKTIEVSENVKFESGKIKTLKYGFTYDATPSTISDVIDLGEGRTALTMGTVVAKNKRGFIFKDDTGTILVYHGNYNDVMPEVKIGDEVKVSGTTGSHGGLVQLEPIYVEILSTGNTYEQPKPDELDGAGLDAMLDAKEISYIKYSGRLNKSGDYYNVTVEGTTTAVGSIQYPISELGVDDLSGKTISLTGYFVGVSSSKYVNTVAVAVEEIEGSDPDPQPQVPATYSSNITWKLGEGAYGEKANINYNKDIPVLKLGSSKKVGTATFSVPEGTTKIGFYALAWNGKEGAVEIKQGNTVVYTGDFPNNPGVVGSKPYTITVDGNTCYQEIPIDASKGTDFTISTVEGKLRVIIWGLNAYGGSAGGDGETPDTGDGETPGTGEGGDKSVTISLTGGTNTNGEWEFNSAQITVAATVGTHTTKPRLDADCLRFYGTADKSNTLTISGATITKIEFTMNGNYNMDKVTPNVGTLSGTTWTGSSTEIKFTTTAQTRIEGVTVYYQ